MDILALPRRAAADLDRVVVLLVASGSRFADLSRHLPPHWTVLRGVTPDAPVRDPDVVVLDEPGRKEVTVACLRHPVASIVAVLSPYSDHREVVAVLEAGADACVRSGTTAVVAAHVEACHRRRAAEKEFGVSDNIFQRALSDGSTIDNALVMGQSESRLESALWRTGGPGDQPIVQVNS